jgi:rhamnose utilization protein RhaD (predicted bifunctional aldolase and dehydrogenase)/NAD(P)-dependent dehydrogenase (short-subunit alcohol dehydrogenase family)
MPNVIASLRSNPETQIVSNLRKLVIGSLRSNPEKIQWIASQARNDVYSNEIRFYVIKKNVIFVFFMNKEINQLIEISRYYGRDNRYVIAGGGNTSFKNDGKLWIKASGHALDAITEEGFAVLDRKKLALMSKKTYNSDPAIREEEVKNDLAAACLTKNRRPSVETSLHNALKYSFVVHLHPTTVNGLMCSQRAESETKRLFGDKAIYIPYTDPGYTLFKEVENRIKTYHAQHGEEPTIVFLQNHGIFVGADTVEQIKQIYEYVIDRIEQAAVPVYSTCEDDSQISDCVLEVIPAIRMMLSADSLKTLKIRNNSLITRFTASEKEFAKIARPFSPDIIVYCKSEYIYIAWDNKDELLAKADRQIKTYIRKWGHAPKVMLIKHIGLVAVGDHAAGCDIILDVYEDMMKITAIAQSFGGEHPMTQAQIDFIDNWEVENYRRKINDGQTSGRFENKTVIITGAAQGFGEGIARSLIMEGANIVVADLNEEAGKATATALCGMVKNNRAIFVQTNVTDTESLRNLIHQTICCFGGLDVFISNAGVLRAGSLEDMTPENFDFVTKVNYNAFFYCTQAASQVMKLQNKYASDNYGDIIQINSKSGLRGSKANFAYAGGKFGGIGLTQSFALELAPFRIKVNAVCPGNFYEGPLWADPETGLFVQYLRAGKVPGAATIEDVRTFYMNQVPMRKGTSPEDVAKAILYLIEQTCETGQALPVTGGQVMVN